MSALAASGIRVERRDGAVLVDGVDLALAPGQVTGVVGETGAGKTLTMRALLGLVPPALRVSGAMRLADGAETPLADARAVARRRGRELGIVLQNPFGSFDPLLRIGRQMTEAVVRLELMSAGDAHARARSLLDAMGFPDPVAVLELWPHELSGGMLQRVAIAAAMMPAPSVLVADEPTSALDAHLRLDVLRLLRDVSRDERTAVLLVSHDLGLVSHSCDEVVVMYAGRVVEAGPCAEVLDAPGHPYTRALLRCSLRLDLPPRTPLSTIEGAAPRIGEERVGCAFAPRCPVRIEACGSLRPAEAPAVGGHVVSCHLAEEVACPLP